jgi:hypothetical protein
MIKVRKTYVLVMAGLLASLFIVSASAAFGFSSPLTTIVAGPGLGAAGPTTFNTYSNSANMANVGTAADVAVNGFSPVPGVLPPVPFGWGGFGPFGVANAANSLATANAAQSDTFATSFSTAGGVAGFGGIGACNFAGAFPEFSLNLF